MFNVKRLHNNEAGQTALETAIILIAFVVVASVFAFAILSAGSASTDKGQKAINAGLEGVQSSMAVKGSVLADGASNAVTDVKVTLALVAGGDPVDMGAVVYSYRDATQSATITVDSTSGINWVKYNGSASDAMLEQGEMAEITLDLASLTTSLGPNTNFTIEIKPPKGAVIQINRTTPAAINAVNDLH